MRFHRSADRPAGSTQIRVSCTPPLRRWPAWIVSPLRTAVPSDNLSQTADALLRARDLAESVPCPSCEIRIEEYLASDLCRDGGGDQRDFVGPGRLRGLTKLDG